MSRRACLYRPRPRPFPLFPRFSLSFSRLRSVSKRIVSWLLVFCRAAGAAVADTSSSSCSSSLLWIADVDPLWSPSAPSSSSAPSIIAIFPLPLTPDSVRLEVDDVEVLECRGFVAFRASACCRSLFANFALKSTSTSQLWVPAVPSSRASCMTCSLAGRESTGLAEREDRAEGGLGDRDGGRSNCSGS